jgi:hypothetical protein
MNKAGQFLQLVEGSEWTVERVKKELPEIVVRKSLKGRYSNIKAKLKDEGKNASFTVEYPKYNNGVNTMAHHIQGISWDDVVNSLNSGKPIKI